MMRGGLTRLAHRLGVTLLILEMAHVPLPIPEQRLPSCECPSDRTSETSGPSDAELEWHWVAPAPEAIDDDGLAALEALEDASSEACRASDSARCPHVAAPHKARLHHFVRGHSSKGFAKLVAERSGFLSLVDEAAKGLNPHENDLARMPRAAMLQRWRC